MAISLCLILPLQALVGVEWGDMSQSVNQFDRIVPSSSVWRNHKHVLGLYISISDLSHVLCERWWAIYPVLLRQTWLTTDNLSEAETDRLWRNAWPYVTPNCHQCLFCFQCGRACSLLLPVKEWLRGKTARRPPEVLPFSHRQCQELCVLHSVVNQIMLSLFL